MLEDQQSEIDVPCSIFYLTAFQHRLGFAFDLGMTT